MYTNIEGGQLNPAELLFTNNHIGSGAKHTEVLVGCELSANWQSQFVNMFSAHTEHLQQLNRLALCSSVPCE